MSHGHEVADLGTDSARTVGRLPRLRRGGGQRVAGGEADFGVLVCGTGLGMAIAANKVDGVRAVNVTDPEFAKLAREHNDANVVAVSGRFIPERAQRGDRRRVSRHGVRGGDTRGVSTRSPGPSSTKRSGAGIALTHESETKGITTTWHLRYIPDAGP